MAVGADDLADPRYLTAVIDVAMRGLPHAFRDVSGEAGQIVAIDISGPSGGDWTLSREQHGWTLWRGKPSTATARVRLSDQTAWKLLFNALAPDDARRMVHIEGRTDLGLALLHARSLIV
jgi:hypothetical protein